MENSLKKHLYKMKLTIFSYVATNRLFIFFVLSSIISNILIRSYTIGNAFSIKPLIVDTGIILFVGAFGYMIKPKQQFLYYFMWSLFFALINTVNSIFYVFFQDFVSFSLLDVAGQVNDVGGSLFEKVELRQYIYVLAPILLYYLNYSLSKWNYFNLVEKVEKGKKLFLNTMIVVAVCLGLTLLTMQASDYSRLTKQWNRDYVVERFGITMYQINDLIQTLTPKFNALFGYEEAANEYITFFEEQASSEKPTNEYTNILRDYNVIFVHMESIQTFLMDLSFNDQEVTPNINQIASEGIFFDNFHAQISVGTSSDTEFSLLTSLMPAQSGTVFVSYADREYVSIPKILGEKGYYTFSMHGNKASMWNRDKMHANLGYQEKYFKPIFTIDEVIGLGLSDKSFFRQTLPILEGIEQEKEKYMGTLIMLSNHSPFEDLEKYGEFDLSYKELDENGSIIYENPYLENTKMGNYIKSAHYADEALGEFMEAVNNSSAFDKTLFVFYGDHEARLSRSAFNHLYNYNPITQEIREEDDEDYIKYDNYIHQINKKVPLILWTKKGALEGKYSYPMGMIDILPTVGNMVGFESKYALGNDIFDKKNDNIVIFPNANFLTKNVYYNNSKEEYIVLNEEPIDENFINECKEYTDMRLRISNNIIVHDLIRKEPEILESRGLLNEEKE